MAAELKDEGNRLFKEGNVEGAAACYQQCLRQLAINRASADSLPDAAAPPSTSLRVPENDAPPRDFATFCGASSNLALCYLRLGRHTDAERQCTALLQALQGQQQKQLDVLSDEAGVAGRPSSPSASEPAISASALRSFRMKALFRRAEARCVLCPSDALADLDMVLSIEPFNARAADERRKVAVAVSTAAAAAAAAAAEAEAAVTEAEAAAGAVRVRVRVPRRW
jgi:tetratricopeptide (TPR) repeat protein